MCRAVGLSRCLQIRKSSFLAFPPLVAATNHRAIRPLPVHVLIHVLDGFFKISAILAADVAGYTRLVADDEEETIRRLTKYRETFADLVSHSDGRNLANSPWVMFSRRFIRGIGRRDL
jgi:hypothetical protein